MGFLLKKLTSYWMMPLPFSLLLLVVGWWLLRSKRGARVGRALIGAAVLLLLVVCNKTLSVWLIQPFESAYAPIPEIAAGAPLPAELARCRYIVVLGSGHSDTPELSAVNRLCEAAHSRLLESTRLLRLLPDAQLVTSGRGAPGQPSHAAAMADAAVSLGVERSRILTLDGPRDTEEEAHDIKALIGDAPFALVTTAWHLPRAMRLMEHAGLHPLACPCDYSARQSAPRSWGDGLWDVESLSRSTRAVHEALGLTWMKLKGH